MNEIYLFKAAFFPSFCFRKSSELLFSSREFCSKLSRVELRCGPRHFPQLHAEKERER